MAREKTDSLDRYQQKIQTFIAMGKLLANLSTCKRDKVSAIIFPCDCSSVLSIGHNGPAQGLPNDSCTEEEGSCGCVHAEANAIVKLNIMGKPSILYSTRMPCLTCAGMILNCSCIKAVVFTYSYRNNLGYDLIVKAGMSIQYEIGLNLILQDLKYWKKQC